MESCSPILPGFLAFTLGCLFVIITVIAIGEFIASLFTSRDKWFRWVLIALVLFGILNLFCDAGGTWRIF